MQLLPKQRVHDLPTTRNDNTSTDSDTSILRPAKIAQNTDQNKHAQNLRTPREPISSHIVQSCMPKKGVSRGHLVTMSRCCRCCRIFFKRVRAIIEGSPINSRCIAQARARNTLRANCSFPWNGSLMRGRGGTCAFHAIRLFALQIEDSGGM